MDPSPPEPSWRKPAGIALILLVILLWAGLVAQFAGAVGRWPVLVQAPFYLIAAIGWIMPLKPLVRWIETGSWRARPAATGKPPAPPLYPD